MDRRTETAAPATATPTAPGRAPERPPGPLLALSAAIGNQSVSRAIVAREPAAGDGGAGGAGNQALPSTGGGGGPAHPHIDLASATTEQKLAELDPAIAAHDSAYIADIWNSFGDVRAMAREHADLFVRSANVALYLYDHFKDEQEAFKKAVEGKALEHLQANRDYVAQEMGRLGIAEGPDPKQSPDQEKAMAETQALAREAERALKAKEQLLNVVVALVNEPPDPDGIPMGDVPVNFNPAHRVVPDTDDKPGDRTWDEVNVQWLNTQKTLANIQATSPGVFALTSAAGDLEPGGTNKSDLGKAATRAGDLAEADPKSAAAYLEASLSALMKKLEATAGDVGSTYTWDQLGMLHPQVLEAPPFDKTVEHAAARHALGEKAAGKAAVDAALTGVSIAAALFGLFATGGLAAALAVTSAVASGSTAVRSIADYNRLATLREARTGDTSHDLVESQAVDAAAAQAVLDTIFAFLDGISAVKAIKDLGGAAAVVEKMGRFKELPAAEKSTVFSAAMESMGEAKALESVGGIGAARAELKGSGALGRAEAYSRSVADHIGAELGAREAREAAQAKVLGPGGPAAEPIGPPRPPATPEELLEQARDIAAEQTKLPRDKALEVVCPQLNSPESVARMVEQLSASAGKASEEYARLGTAEARLARMHEITGDFARSRQLPVPEVKKGASNHFEKETWTISYNEAAVQAETMTQAEWELQRSVGVHELQHSQQFIDIARYRMGMGESIEEVGRSLNIHRKGLEAAERMGPLKPGQLGYADAEAFYESIFGVNRFHRERVLADLEKYQGEVREWEKASKESERLAKELETLKADGGPRKEIEALQQQWEAADNAAEDLEMKVRRNTAERDAVFKEYQDLPEEKDAWGVHEEYQAAQRDYRQAQDAQRAAREAAERAMGSGERKASGEWDIHDEDAVWDKEADPLRQP